MDYSVENYPYLLTEDINAARAGRATEDEFLAMVGGLKAYNDLMNNRELARGAKVNDLTFEVPPLPQTVDELMAKIQLPGLEPKAMLASLVKDHVAQVQGIMDAVKFDTSLKATTAREAEQKAGQKAYDLKELAKRNPFNFPPESQSARDWAAGEYANKNKRRG